MESTAQGVPGFGSRVRGLRIALGAAALALGWLVVGAVSGGATASAAELPPLTPDALATVATTAPIAADQLLATLPAVAAVTGPSAIQDATAYAVAPVVRVATDALERVADAVDLTAVEDILPALPDLLPPGAAPTGVIAAAEIGGAVLPTAAAPSLGSVPSSASPSSASAAALVSEPMPAPAGPATPATPAESVVPTAPAGVAEECDLSRAPWAVLASGSALPPSRNDALPCPPAFDFDPTPD